MSESTLEERIRAELTGVILHRQKSIHPFADIDSPLVDLLFSITRPSRPSRSKKKQLLPETEAAPATPTEMIVLPKAMVPYRRELWGEVPKTEKPV